MPRRAWELPKISSTFREEVVVAFRGPDGRQRTRCSLHHIMNRSSWSKEASNRPRQDA
jgi:hypothetical protein